MNSAHQPNFSLASAGTVWPFPLPSQGERWVRDGVSGFWFSTRLLLSMAVMLVLARLDSNAQVATSLAPFAYQNQLYSPAPNPIPGVTNSPQPKGIAIFNGNVGPAGQPGTPNNGSYYLVQSGFGQPAAEPRLPDFLIGQQIIPDSALQADLTKAPDINPPTRAFYIADVGKVFANEAGLVDITWRRADNSPAGPIKYLIDRRPIRTPVAIYHTHNPTPDPGSDFTSNPLPLPQTRAPLVDVSGVQQIVFHWNTALPQDTNTPYLLRTASGNLYAKDRTGIILLEYRENGAFAGLEIVAVRSNITPDGPPTLTDIGSQLIPFTLPPTSAPPVVVKGLGIGPPESQFVYQHANQSSPQYGSVFAVRKTATPDDIQVYWMARSLKNVVWPYEFHLYSADWPSSAPNYQLYVRGDGGILGPNVQIPQSKTATLMPFQEPNGHASQVLNASFSTFAAGWSLLKYDQTNDVSFQVVKSVLH